MSGGIIAIILAAIGGGALALWAARLARRFIAFGERRFDEVYGDVVELPAAARKAGGKPSGRSGRVTGLVARHDRKGL